MNDLWFISDTHFNHAKIVQYSNRPFANVEAMNEGLVEVWNRRVKPGDHVYHLGDFAFVRNTEDITSLLKRLNGQIHLIRGNHDHRDVRNAKGFAEVLDYKELKVGDQRVVLSHYPMLSWSGMHKGSWMLHGHCHGNLAKNVMARRLDVGVDPMGYKPVSFDEVAVVMREYGFAPVDHHGADHVDE